MTVGRVAGSEMSADGRDIAIWHQRCDTYERGGQETAPVSKDQPSAIGHRVKHRFLGEGRVTHHEDDTVVVLFDKGGYRTLLVPHVLEGQLIEPLTS